MKKDELHNWIAGRALKRSGDETDSLALMLLFHTHVFRLQSPFVEGLPNEVDSPPMTQRCCADAVAIVWPDRTDAKRTHYYFWYKKFNLTTPCEIAEDIPPEWMERVERLRDVVEGIDGIESVFPED
ncbi:MAG TPA: hypothetical protein PK093_16285 [Phycisphaerae bacterium]|nr:hypothetical protein [Phycisphaerae bacterium]